MIEKKKWEYTAPTVELIEARVEKGFLTSGSETEDPTALNKYNFTGSQESKFS